MSGEEAGQATEATGAREATQATGARRRRYVTCSDLAERTAQLMAGLMALVSFAAAGGDKETVITKLKEMAGEMAELHDDALRVLRYERSRSNTGYTGRRNTRSGGGVSWRRTRSRY